MSLKLKLRLTPSGSAQSAAPPVTEPPRNSFTMTDYYRATREEYYSPISRAESLSPGSLYADSSTSPTQLGHIQEGSELDLSDDEGVEEAAASAGAGAARVPKRTAVFWHVFDALFRKWRRQKVGNNNYHKTPRAHAHL
ncbi:hypothetical protein MVEN_02004100 [Mycena venus]|uniref:Uncharacterized protein n=1 Tax=Mycena venus TaxID=2733690 RepID=A0A8H6XBR4_9AGAR|nr:hypothetical protein MVEN_02004100 [Mycena venus]